MVSKLSLINFEFLFPFQTYDYKRLYNSMLKPAFIFDGRIILNHQELIDIGFHVETIGKRLARCNVYRPFAATS